jgi:hypothetical protein
LSADFHPIRLKLFQLFFQKFRAAWFDVDAKDSHFIPILVDNGFEFHHCSSANEVTMIKWMAPDEESQVRDTDGHIPTGGDQDRGTRLGEFSPVG